MRYRSAFIGCGPRAVCHGEAYDHVASIDIVAAADLDEQRMSAFADRFAIPGRHTDYRAMLAEERPDIVHCVTQPNFRVEPVRACAQAGVRAIIVEKPMAANLAAAEEIETVAQETGIRVIVNTQRRYFPSWQGVCDLFQRGQAGSIRSIRIACNPALSCLGSHVLDMAQMLLGDPDPESVWATAYGAEDWHTTHPGPSSVLASLIYPGRIPLHLELSKQAVSVKGCPNFWLSTGIDILTDRGHVWWTESNGWGYHLHGMAQPDRFPSDFVGDDPIGQGAFTEAVATWLSDPSRPHGNRLETAIRVYRIVCAIIQSAARGGRMAFDPNRLQDCFDELRAQLIEREGDHPKRVDWATCVEAGSVW